jgi:hypothetical protein
LLEAPFFAFVAVLSYRERIYHMTEDSRLKDHNDGIAVEHDIDEKPGALFRWLHPRDPVKARRRFGKLFWRGWKRLTLSFFLSAFGVTFLLIGGACMKMCEEFDRGVAFFVIGCILVLPGFYGLTILLMYVRCIGRAHYKQLPDYD